MDFRDLIINEGIKIGAYFIKNSKPKVTTTIPTTKDLEERLKALQSKSSEQFPRPVLGKTIEIPSENKSIESGARKGIACTLCSDEHLSEVSGALSEALRFARNEGLGTKEVIRRIRHARDELNEMERFDLAPEEIIKLPEDEQEIAHWVLPKSRDLRHSINSAQTVEDLEKASAQAANLADTFAEKLTKCKPRLETKEVKTALPPEIEALKRMVEQKKND